VTRSFRSWAGRGRNGSRGRLRARHELLIRLQPTLRAREIPVDRVRVGYIPGTHELGFDSDADIILLRHEARSGRGFVEGARR